MNLSDPSAEEQQAVQAGVAWLRKTAIYGQIWGPTREGRKLLAHEGAGPLWARYYLSGADTPIFGDRDKSIHDNVMEISSERRNGYAWYTTEPKAALDRFDAWAMNHPEAK
jgi:PelA/Pel-15E family pectate lyase